MGPKRPSLATAFRTSDGRKLNTQKSVTFGGAREPVEDIISEHTPLMGSQSSSDGGELVKIISPVPGWPVGNDNDEDSEEETKSTLFLFLLTLGGLGLQIGWSVETSNGSVSIFESPFNCLR